MSLKSGCIHSIGRLFLLCSTRIRMVSYNQWSLRSDLLGSSPASPSKIMDCCTSCLSLWPSRLHSTTGLSLSFLLLNHRASGQWHSSLESFPHPRAPPLTPVHAGFSGHEVAAWMSHLLGEACWPSNWMQLYCPETVAIRLPSFIVIKAPTLTFSFICLFPH